MNGTGNAAAMGGAILSRGDLIIENCIFRLNDASQAGGSIYVEGGDLTLKGTLFDNTNDRGEATTGLNTEKGGAVYIAAGVLEATDCTFTGSVSASGGAVHAEGAISAGSFVTSTFTNCIFTLNESGSGGALCNNGGGPPGAGNATMTLNNCIMRDNQGGYHGGAIANMSAAGGLATLRATRCMISGNYGDSAGGLYNWSDRRSTATALITNCTLENNGALSGGGAVYNLTAATSTVVITGCLFKGNRGGDLGGGAIFNATAIGGGGHAKIVARNSTFSANESFKNGDSEPAHGGAVHSEATADGITEVDLTNCTFANNRGSRADTLHNYSFGLTAKATMRIGNCISCLAR